MRMRIGVVMGSFLVALTATFAFAGESGERAPKMRVVSDDEAARVFGGHCGNNCKNLKENKWPAGCEHCALVWCSDMDGNTRDQDCESGQDPHDDCTGTRIEEDHQNCHRQCDEDTENNCTAHLKDYLCIDKGHVKDDSNDTFVCTY